MSFKKIFFFIFCFFFIFNLSSAVQSAERESTVDIYFFWGIGCPHCENQKVFLADLIERYPEVTVKDFEIYRSQENQELLQKIARAYEINVWGVPMTFIGDRAISGFGGARITGRDIENAIKECLAQGCLSPEERIVEKEDPLLAPVKLCVHLFTKDECQPCSDLMPFLSELSDKYDLDFNIYNISEGETNRAIHKELLSYYKISSPGFPIIFMGGSYLVGEQRIRQNIESIIVHCLKEGCPCPVKSIEGAITHLPGKGDFAPDDTLFELSLFGRDISITAESSLPWLTVGLGLVDGINPCTLSVLFFLLTYLLAIGSRRKAVKVGLSFTLTVFVVYLIFMLGILNLIALIGSIHRIKIFVAIIALVAGLIMLKDFFYYGRWISLEIPGRTKPVIKRLIQKGTIPSAIILGVLASLVELPCTSGIPLVYTTVLAQQQIVGLRALSYLAAYNFFYIVPLLLIIGMVAFVLLKMEDAEAWRLRFRKYMRLLSGVILLFLGVALLMGWM